MSKTLQLPSGRKLHISVGDKQSTGKTLQLPSGRKLSVSVESKKESK